MNVQRMICLSVFMVLANLQVSAQASCLLAYREAARNNTDASLFAAQNSVQGAGVAGASGYVAGAMIGAGALAAPAGLVAGVAAGGATTTIAGQKYFSALDAGTVVSWLEESEVGDGLNIREMLDEKKSDADPEIIAQILAAASSQNLLCLDGQVMKSAEVTQIVLAEYDRLLKSR